MMPIVGGRAARRSPCRHVSSGRGVSLPRVHRVTRWAQNVSAGEIGRLRCRGHIDPSALSGFGLAVGVRLGMTHRKDSRSLPWRFEYFG